MSLLTKTSGGFYQAHNAVVIGQIAIGELSSIWFNVVIRGDVAPITLGRRVNVQDGAIIHCDSGIPCVIEDDVTIGHGAIVHGRYIGRASLIGMGARLLARTQIGSECLIAAGTVVPPDLQVPDRVLVMGVPGKVVRPVNSEELTYLRWLAAHYADLADRHVRGEFDGATPPVPSTVAPGDRP